MSNPDNIGQNLNKISAFMPFGHTSYVPADETQNFCSLFPLTDDLKTRLDDKPSILIDVDSEIYPPKKVLKFEKKIKEHPLPCNDYRTLAWNGKASQDMDSQPLNVGPSRITRRTVNGSLTNLFTSITDLEAYYRGSASTTFRIDPRSCHLIDQQAALGQDRKLRRRLGSSVILLNDPVYAEWLRNMVQKEMEEKDEEQCLNRIEKEIYRDKKSKMIGLNAIDDLLMSLRLPEICEQKPWLIKYGKKSQRPQTSVRTSKHKRMEHVTLPPIDNATRKVSSGTDLGEIVNEEEEEETESPLKLPSLNRDRLSELNNMTGLFDRAKEVLVSPEAYTKYSVHGEVEK